jgi:hypothetical protein
MSFSFLPFSKVVSFGAGNYGYKDGHGGDLHECPSLDAFNADFKTMELCFRRADNAALLSAQAQITGGPDLRCRSNFNVTRCAAEMHQHTWALRMGKTIMDLGSAEPMKARHDFTGPRWTELQEIQAIEQLTGSLTMKCQMENVASAGYWFYWLEKAFATLAGRLPMAVVDVDRIGKSPRLPTVMRDPNTFRALSQLVRGRHQVEFKRRFGLTGDKTGLDVANDWRPTMTPAFGLPIMLDPRMNNIPTKFGLDETQVVEYEELLHGIHYQWYLRARTTKEREWQRIRDDFLKANPPQQKKPKSPEETTDIDMGWGDDNAARAQDDPVQQEVLPEVKPVPLILEHDFRIASRTQYTAYKEGCKGVPWMRMFPQQKYQVGVKNSFWQEKLHDVQLGPVWRCLKQENKDGKFGFFIQASYPSSDLPHVVTSHMISSATAGR